MILEQATEAVKTRNYEQEFEEKTGIKFNKFYRTYHPKLLFFIKNIVRDEDDALDLVSEAFMKSLQKIEQYNSKYNFSTWLWVMAKKMAIQHLKDKGKHYTISLSVHDDGDRTLADTIADTIDEEEYIDSKFNKKCDVILEHIDLLEPKYRTVIEMRELQDMAYKDIADLLGINLQTVKSQIRQGRLILQTRVKAQLEEIDDIY